MKIEMTEVQKAYLLGRNEAFDGKTGTHMYLEVEFEGDLKSFEHAFNKIIEVQPMLRAKVKNLTSFEIIDCYNYSINCIKVDDQNFEEVRNSRRIALSHKLYSQDAFPFYTIEALSKESGSHLILISIDLLIADGLSLFYLFDTIKKILKNNDFVLEDRSKELVEINTMYLEEKNSNRYVKDKDYWLSSLEILPDAPNLLLHEEKANKSKFERKEYIFSSKELERLQKIAKIEDCSLSSILLAIYSLTLQQWSENDQFTINMTTFKRPRKKKYLEVIGDFTSTTLVNTNVDKSVSTIENSKSVQRNIFSSMRRSKFEGIEVLRELKKTHRKHIMPFVFTSMLFEFDSFDELGTIAYWISETPQVYLDCQIKMLNGGLHVSWDYLEDIFEPMQITEMFDIFIRHIEKFIENPNTSMVETNQYLNKRINEKYHKYNSVKNIITSPTKHILSSFNNVRIKYPSKIAFSDSSSEITFSELNKKSDSVLKKIQRIKDKQHLGKIRIGISGEKNLNSVINMLAVLKAKDSFCFISDETPEKRYRALIEDNSLAIIINENEVNYLSNIQLQKIQKDELYIVFTSGTTGKPKGISINENAVLNTIDDILIRAKLTNEDVIFNISDLTFDLSIFDVIAPLISGCSTFLCADPTEISKHSVQISKTTFWNSTPGLVQVLMSVNNKPISSIRSVLMSGDFIPASLVKKIKSQFSNPKVNIWSLGGATEASIWSIYYPLNKFEGDKVPYGYPLSNQKFYVLNDSDCLLNSNVVGELVIAGKGLASGYTDALSNENVFYSHNKLGSIYRTGDKGYLTDEGTLIILGRIKTDLKLNGYRVDLKEIEKSLNDLPEVTDSRVFIFKNDNQKGYLTAFYKSSQELTSIELRGRLTSSLPKYMIPTSYIPLQKFPLTPNGKVDLEALMDLQKNNNVDSILTEEEERLLGLWLEVIEDSVDKKTISKMSTFFEIGGDSIKLPELIYVINTHYEIDVSIEELLNNFTLQEQAILLKEMSTKNEATLVTNSLVSRIKKGTSDKNIILIHAGSGEVGIYNSLSMNIDDSYNVYAIRFDKTTRDLTPNLFDFTELAKTYNEYLTSFDDIDYIGGWCIGGALGYEICKINQSVKNLLLINTLPPVEEQKKVFTFLLEDEVQFIKESFGVTFKNVNSVTELWIEISNILKKNPEMLEKLVSIVPKELSRLIPFFGENNSDELLYYINLFRSFETTRMQYQDSEIINQNVTYIGAADEKIVDYYNWRQRTNGEWDETHISGDHTTIFDFPNVIKIAEHINNKNW